MWRVARVRRDAYMRAPDLYQQFVERVKVTNVPDGCGHADFFIGMLRDMMGPRDANLAAIPPAAIPTAAIPTAAIPTVADHIAAIPPAAIPTVADHIAAIPAAAIPTAAIPTTADHIAAIPTAADHIAAEPMAADPNPNTINAKVRLLDLQKDLLLCSCCLRVSCWRTMSCCAAAPRVCPQTLTARGPSPDGGAPAASPKQRIFGPRATRDANAAQRNNATVRPTPPTAGARMSRTSLCTLTTATTLCLRGVAATCPQTRGLQPPARQDAAAMTEPGTAPANPIPANDLTRDRATARSAAPPHPTTTAAQGDMTRQVRNGRAVTSRGPSGTSACTLAACAGVAGLVHTISHVLTRVAARVAGRRPPPEGRALQVAVPTGHKRRRHLGRRPSAAAARQACQDLAQHGRPQPQQCHHRRRRHRQRHRPVPRRSHVHAQ